MQNAGENTVPLARRLLLRVSEPVTRGVYHTNVLSPLDGRRYGPPMLSEDEYVTLAQKELNDIIRALDELSADELSCELENDIITIEFDDDEISYVINSHRAARQIWMAADRKAWHFDWNEDEETWVSSKSDEELWSTIRHVLSKRLDADEVESVIQPSN